jgi:hypothetical protein
VQAVQLQRIEEIETAIKLLEQGKAFLESF